ncbi:solute carrier organic anion transporter family member 2A1-like [Patiria miniata]|uniref:Solute carrier organic anion transporter family member n=1 Tax=Patiria miniata TaxID=46514 RepID=A0A914ASP8_PATMI|nr:solute carrier organic anion transporter family member 2A1-like [Patiria miniata]
MAESSAKYSKTLDILPAREADGCGIRCWEPPFLKRLARPWVFLVAMCVYTAIDGINIGMSTGTITSVEAHFQLTLTELGSMTTVYCVGGILGILLAFCVGTVVPGCKPCLLGVSGISLGLGALMLALPAFLHDLYLPPSVVLATGDNSTQGFAGETSACYDSDITEECSSVSDNVAVDSASMSLFYLGMFLQGVGMISYPIGIAYIADCSSPGTTAVYMGIINAVLGMGPAVGVMLAAAFIGIWVDFYRLVGAETDLSLGPGDPGWIGAWWLGFIVLAVLFCLSAALFPLFPRRMPSSAHRQPDDEHETTEKFTSNETHEAENDNEGNHQFLDIKEFMWTVWRTLKNPTCSLTCLSQSTFYFIMYGYGIFVPKYLEVQFGYDRQTADLLTGVLLAPAYAVGELLAGFLVKKLELTLHGTVRLTCVVLTACVVGMALLMVIGCANDNVAGVFSTYDGVSSLASVDLEAPCNQNCSCSMALYAPVCSDAGLTYFSPCHAGCNVIGAQGNFSDCACPMMLGDGSLYSTARSASVVDGACGTQCTSAVPFLLVLTGVFVLATFGDLLRLTIIVRSVTSESRLVALSVAYLTQVIGVVASGQVFGMVIDGACVVWQESCAGQQGACLLYDNRPYRLAYNGLALAVGIFSAAVMFLVLLWPTGRNHRSTVRRGGPAMTSVTASV